MKLLVLNSGGYDSTVCLEWAIRNGHSASSLFFDYNQHTLEVESKFARMNSEIRGIDFRYVKVPLSWGLPIPTKFNQYVPYRNLIFLSTALSIAEAENFNGIVVGVVKCPPEHYYADSSPQFINWFRKQSEVAGIKILTPLMYKTKEEVYRMGRELNIDPSDTWSCDSAEKMCGYKFIRCGKCNDCMQLKGAIAEGVFNTPLEFFYK